MLWYSLGATEPNQWLFPVVIVVVVLLFVVWIFFSGRRNKQRQKEYVEQLEALRPGHKVKTVGGICGIVAEVCDDNTVIIETGSEATGKSFIKLDKEFIGQTDAKGPTQLAREQAEAARKAEKEQRAAEKANASKEAKPAESAAPEAPAAPVEPAEPEKPAEQPAEPEAPAEEQK